MPVWSSFSDDDVTFAARADHAAPLRAQEAELTAQARLAVAMLQRLQADERNGHQSDHFSRAHDLAHEVERGNLSAADAVAQLSAEKFAPPDTVDDADDAEEDVEVAGEDAEDVSPPQIFTAAFRQKAHLATHPHPYARALRPHMNPAWTWHNEPRFVDRASAVEKQTRGQRGPAAYAPQWQADSTRRPVPRSAFWPTAARFAPLAADGGATGASDAPFCAPVSSVGPQASSSHRSQPVHGFGTGGRRPDAHAALSSTPGPGAYNA